MNKLKTDSLRLHEEARGKLETAIKVPCNTMEDLSLAYSPGVAYPCLEIKESTNDIYKYTNKGNTVAVITDGSAVLGLGNIGPEAALPVMEGKALLFKKFANVDAMPICLNTQDTEEIIRTCELLAPSIGGINLEDISAPRCVEIERELSKRLNIPVFHDDQHGTAIVVLAGLINAMKLTKRNIEDTRVVISGTGAAGSSIIKHLYNYGFRNIVAFDATGVLVKKHSDSYDFLKKELLEYVNLQNIEYPSLKEAMIGSDIFIGVSAADIVSEEMVKSMNKDAIIFAMANPNPEITYEKAKNAGALIVGTGRSDVPNQVNNILAFPGLFRGLLDAKATKMDEDIKLAVSIAISELVSDEELCCDYVIPNPFDERVVKAVAGAVVDVCKRKGLIRG